MRVRPLLRGMTAVAALTLAATACSTKAPDAASDGAVRTGEGVTDSTLTLGVLSDLSNVFGPLGQSLVQGNELYFNQRNADGGVCGRQVKLEIRDHAYNVQTSVSQFAELEPKVLGFVQLLGSPIVSALAPKIASTGAVTVPATWSTDWLNKDGLVIVGSAYPVDVINGIQYLLDEGKIKKGDTLGHVYFEGDYGSDALKGSKHAADALGLKVKSVQVAPSATDLTAQFNELTSGGAPQAFIVSAGPRQTASIAGLAAGSGLKTPILANGPGFDPALLDTPVGRTLADNLYVATSYEPFAGGSAGARTIADAYTAAHPDGKPTNMVNYGYATASVMGQAIDAACEGGDLTREGLTKALRSLDGVETGVMPVLNLSDASRFPSASSYINRVDPAVKGGLVVAKDPFTSDAATTFTG
ncbi:ABC transporter substrate-binding protein [Actinocorallia sp. A-T 12471]|uniref:ABC transporter substrate-binding protein n=1 Tax=Actinocorallia sp. A-T 12471 TaxID=3089813 RepID=UPI0029D02397|nr:ABC transporter substrate-binding protein [Actinocorallia sp. A-T 12471]MDX6744230.1 ABC transporter substrate-binding protein [Actinocorallia sp. A-T 12471]